MDPGSAAARRLTDPAGALERLAERAGVEFSALSAARQHTADELRARAERLPVAAPEVSASVVLFGSWARAELTPESDHDWALLVDAHEIPAAARELEQAARDVFGEAERKPGAQGIFGGAFTSQELIAQVGLEEDTNTNLTRRMLLLLESVAIGDPSAHRAGLARVLQAYLARGAKDYRPPRFLLNDLIRYWRTICVDFEGKHWTVDDDPKWVTRNAKLRTSRKVLFAGGLIPLLACAAVPRDEQEAFLTEQLAAPPVDRLAAAFLHFDDGAAVDAGVRGLKAYDRFVGLMATRKAREELRALRAETRKASPLWHEIASLGDELQQSLIALLYGPALAPIVKQYAIF